jgi:hypothetical protein
MITRAAAIKNDGFDALGERGFRRQLADGFGAGHVGRELVAVGRALLVVEAAASVTPALSSMNWTWMFSLVKQTLMRGRSFVPLSLLRIRQLRSCFN